MLMQDFLRDVTAESYRPPAEVLTHPEMVQLTRWKWLYSLSNAGFTPDEARHIGLFAHYRATGQR